MYILNLIMIAARIHGRFTAALDDGQPVIYNSLHEIPDDLKGCEVSEIKVVDGMVHLVLHRNMAEMPQDYSFECGI